MRVITGSARGRKLKTLLGDSVRPTADKVKEAMFSIIQFELEGSRVIDLFSGSGQLGIEALSRGAKSAVFVDASRASVDMTEENLTVTGLQQYARVYCSDAPLFLERDGGEYDIAFLDPPYKAGIMMKTLEVLLPHLSERGIAVCETAREEVLPDSFGGFCSHRYQYGKSALTVYRKDASS